MKNVTLITAIVGLFAVVSGSAQAFSTQYDHYRYGDNVYAINNAIHAQDNYGYRYDYGHDFGNFYYYGGYTSYHNPYNNPYYGHQPHYKVKWAPVSCQTIKVKQGCEWVWKKVCHRKW